MDHSCCFSLIERRDAAVPFGLGIVTCLVTQVFG
jgi:hypothetical protein